ncbi:MAG: tetratricopeptide repeat protein, partial [Planctomycetota bacterium]
NSFRQARDTDPTQVQHRINLAAALLKTGQFDVAIRELDTAFELDPASVAAQVYAAEAEVALGRVEEAKARLKSVVEAHPDAVNLWFRLGNLSLESGDYAGGVKNFRRANSLVPDDPTIAGNLAWILATAPDPAIRNGAEAIRLATVAVRATQRQSASPLDALAAAYAEAGRFDEAKATADAALQLLDGEQLEELAAAIANRREGYAKRRPFRLKPSPTTDVDVKP